MLLRFQRKNLIETSSSDSQLSDSKNKFDTIKLMDSNNPLIRLSIFGRLKKMLATYAGKKISFIDRRLFRGLYIRNLNDFDEEIRDKNQNMSLF